MYIYASKYPYMHMFNNENTRYIMAPPMGKKLGFCPLVFQGRLVMVPPVPCTVQDLGDE